MNSNTTDHERAARIRTNRRRVEHIATAALTRIRQTDRDTANMLDGYIAILTAEANAYKAAADTASESKGSSRAGLPDAALAADPGAGGLSNGCPTDPILPRNSGGES